MHFCVFAARWSLAIGWDGSMVFRKMGLNYIKKQIYIYYGSQQLRYLCVSIFVSRFKSPYLVHPGIGEEQSGVIKRNGGRRVDVLVLMAAKEVDELLTDLCSSEGRVHAGSVVLRGLEIYIQTRMSQKSVFTKTLGGVNMHLLCTAVNWYQLKICYGHLQPVRISRTLQDHCINTGTCEGGIWSVKKQSLQIHANRLNPLWHAEKLS